MAAITKICAVKASPPRRRAPPSALVRAGAPAASRGAAARRLGEPGLDPVLEDRPEPRDPGRDPDLAEGVVDPGGHPGLAGGTTPTASRRSPGWSSRSRRRRRGSPASSAVHSDSGVTPRISSSPGRPGRGRRRRRPAPEPGSAAARDRSDEEREQRDRQEPHPASSVVAEHALDVDRDVEEHREHRGRAECDDRDADEGRLATGGGRASAVARASSITTKPSISTEAPISDP